MFSTVCTDFEFYSLQNPNANPINCRVLDLELKKEETKKKTQDLEQMNEDENYESDNEDDIDEFLDWRAKKAYS